MAKQEPHLVLCKDEMTESADAEECQSRLWSMFNVRFQSKLSLPQVERIRWRLFPELRIHQQTLNIDPTDQSSVNPADLLQVMDLAQEKIARNLGDGHRVIHGVAGPGKRELKAQHAAGVPWNEMAVFYTAPFVADEIAQALQDAAVPFTG